LERMDSQWPFWRMVLCLGQIQNPDRGDRPCPGSMFNITLLGPLALQSIKTIIWRPM
jgi:hypothetical protein